MLIELHPHLLEHIRCIVGLRTKRKRHGIHQSFIPDDQVLPCRRVTFNAAVDQFLLDVAYHYLHLWIGPLLPIIIRTHLSKDTTEMPRSVEEAVSDDGIKKSAD